MSNTKLPESVYSKILVKQNFDSIINDPIK